MLIYKDNRLFFRNISLAMPNNITFPRLEDDPGLLVIGDPEETWEIMLGWDAISNDGKLFPEDCDDPVWKDHFIVHPFPIEVCGIAGQQALWGSIGEFIYEVRFPLDDGESCFIVMLTVFSEDETTPKTIKDYPAVKELLSSIRAEDSVK